MYKSQTEIANNRDYDVTYTTEFDQDQTNANLITTSKKLAIKGVYVSTEATAGFVRLLIGNNTVCTFYANIANGYVPVSFTGASAVPLKVTSNLGADKNYFILVNYRDE